VVVAYRASWPDEIYLRGTLSDIREKVRAEKITRTALIMVGPALAQVKDFRDSALYDPQTPHVQGTAKGFAAVIEFIPKDVVDDLARARLAKLTKKTRLRVQAGDMRVPLLRLTATHFAIDRAQAPRLRGLVDIYDGARHLYQALVVATSFEGRAAGHLVAQSHALPRARGHIHDLKILEHDPRLGLRVCACRDEPPLPVLAIVEMQQRQLREAVRVQHLPADHGGGGDGEEADLHKFGGPGGDLLGEQEADIEIVAPGPEVSIAARRVHPKRDARMLGHEAAQARRKPVGGES